MDRIERQIEQVLARHAPPGAQLGDLDGLKKFLKKAAKKIKKVVKKVVPVAAAIVGGVGGAAVASALSKKSKKAKAVIQSVQGMPPVEAATRVAGAYLEDYGMSPQLLMDPQMQSILRAEVQQQPLWAADQELPDVEVSARPNWVVPAAIGAGVLGLALLSRK